jgi:hypothetical protein
MECPTGARRKPRNPKKSLSPKMSRTQSPISALRIHQEPPSLTYVPAEPF